MPDATDGGTRYSIRLTGRKERDPGGGGGTRGAAEAQRDPVGLGPFADLVQATLRDEVRAEVARGTSEEVELEELAPDTVLELELEGGLHWWTTVDRLAEHLDGAAAAGARGAQDKPLVAPDGTLNLPPVLPFGTPTRGIGGLALRVLRRFDVDLPAIAAREVAERLEDRLDPGPGLYRWTRPDALGARIDSDADVPGGGPLLVFLHGTASTTLGSFGALARDDRRAGWRRLEQRYDNRILAFEHRSLSQSPGQNARDLVELLPDGATVHLVSHSRGGLVGELLCRGAFADGRPAFTDEDLAPFAVDEERRADANALRELRDLLAAKELRIERFVRVACPARGTILASKRLDRYLSLLLNTLGLALGSTANPAYQFVKSLVLALAKQRTEPDELPGLEAMMPSSPLIGVLNQGDGRLDADLSVIAGDIEGSSVLGRLKVFATDLFFRHDHDLVVDSQAMFGGGARVRGRAHYVFERSTEINHFLYFTHPATSSLVVDGLLDGADRVTAFRDLEVGTPPEGVRGIQESGMVKPDALDELRDDQPVVVLLPGILGSRLQAGDNVIWLDLSDIVKGRLGRLAIDAADVKAVDLLERTYRETVRFLGRSHQVIPYPYDWRKPVDGEADALAATVAEVLERTGQTVHLLAHSMGGLVARRLRQNHPDLWARLKARERFRFVMLGTPNRGSHSIVDILLGRQAAVRRLALADLTRGTKGVLEIVAAFPGLLSLLPPTSDALGSDPGDDLFDTATWERWRGIDDTTEVPAADNLRGVRELRASLDEETWDDDAICYVAGQAPATAFAAVVNRDARGRERLDVLLSPRGDGQVLWDTGIPRELQRGGRLWYAPGVRHGDLANDSGVLEAVLDLLQRGSTSRLRQDEPAPESAGLRGAVDGAVAPADEPVLFPTEEELEAAAMGGSMTGGEAAEEGTLKVLVTHGSLIYARHPVAVGHYQDDVLAGTEAVVDRYVLGGALDRQHQLDLYPGPVGSADSFLDPRNPRRGALVFGLGRVGELAPGRVSAGIRAAALHYALLVAGMDDWKDVDAGGRRRVSLSSVLVGAGWGSSVGVEDSLGALVEGVAEAAEKLHRHPELKDRVRLVELEIIELYETRALNACEALQRWAARGTLGVGPRLEILPELQRSDGGQREVPSGEAGWWRRLQISLDDSQHAVVEGCEELRPLKFVNLTERARAEVTMVATQRRLVESFVQKSIGDASWRPDQARTLFELLVPNELKEYAPDDMDLLLIVDKHAASYPWELLTDGEGDGEPLSVRAGLLRQLATDRYRRAPVNPVGRDALVVGDPPTGNPRYPRLPGALREAEQVHKRLQETGWSSTDLLGAEPQAVVTALFERPYRVIHIAAHGEFDPQCTLRSGVLLADDMLLTAAEIGQLRQVPELVFLNCCHLGRVTDLPDNALRYRNRLAANLGWQLIEIGVRAVVAAGWVVDDGAADTFARRFYDEMLAGADFGDAVQAARRESWLNHPGVNTWGAYQCYGDPSFRLVEGRSRSKAQQWVDPLRPVLTLDNIRSRAKTGSDPERLAQEIAGIEERLESRHARWLRRGDVREALGRAWAQIGSLVAWTRLEGPDRWASATNEEKQAACRKVVDAIGRAVDHLEAAVASEDGKVSIGTFETLCNLKVRSQAVEFQRRRLAGEPAFLDLVQVVERVIGDLERLNDIGSSTERWALIGSAYKRLAILTDGSKTRAKRLLAARNAYDEAYELARANQGDVAYPAPNLCTCQAALRLVDPGLYKDEIGDDGTLDRLREILATLEVRRWSSNFWHRVVAADAALASLLLDRAVDFPTEDRGRTSEIAARYADAYRQKTSPLEFSSVVEHLDSLVRILDDPRGTAEGDAVTERRRGAHRAVRTVLSELMSLLRRMATDP